MTNDPWSALAEAKQPSAKPEWLTPELEAMLLNDKLPLDKDGMLLLWQRVQRKLTIIKEMEMSYRKICAAFLVPAKTEGTNTVELGNGYQAKVVNKYNYKPNPENKIIWKALEKIEAIGNQGKFIAERLFSWSPNFLLTEYRKLQEDAQEGSEDAKAILKIVNTDMITIEEASPTLEIREPKEKKK